MESTVSGTRKGNDSLYREAYEKHYEGLLHFAATIVAEEEVAKDMVQEAFLSLLEKDLHFISEEALRSYLYTSVKHAALDYLKHQEVENHYVESVLNEGNAAWEESLDEEIYRLLFKAIDTLPDRCREIFLLHLDGHSNQQIADRLQLSVLTVKTQNKKAMHLLREYFQEPSHRDAFFHDQTWIIVLSLLH